MTKKLPEKARASFVAGSWVVECPYKPCRRICVVDVPGGQCKVCPFCDVPFRVV